MRFLKRLLAFLSTKRSDEHVEIQTPTLETKEHKKLAGFDYLDILHVWVKSEYAGAHVIVLTEINAEAKDVEFWARIPKGQALEFLKDVVVLYCKDMSEIEKLVPSIGTKFATAYGFCDGNLVLTNKEL
jgi:hypothetical protein